MKIARLASAAIAVALGVGMCFALTGCGDTGSKEVTLSPTVDNSALVTSGTLTVGVDTSQPPFASIVTGETDSEGKTTSNKIVGLDVDVAAAIADELGLKLQVVDIKDSSARSALGNGEVDMVMSASSTQTTNSNQMLIGPYLDNSPAIFGLDDGSSSKVEPSDLASSKVGAYTGSIAATLALEYCGTSNLVLSSSMKEMFENLQSGSVQYVASDVVSGGYMSMLFNGIVCKGSFGGGNACYMAVLQSNSALSQKVTSALSTIDGNGVLDTIIAKWCGETAVQYASPEVQAPFESGAGQQDTTEDSSQQGGA